MGMRGLWVVVSGIRVGMQGITVGIRGIGGGKVERNKNKRK